MLVDFEKLTDEQIEAYKAAAREEKISPESLIGEFVPFIDENFIAQVKICKKSVHLDFVNGQKFVVYFKEI